MPRLAVIPIKISCGTEKISLRFGVSSNTKVDAPKIVGIAIKNENRVACTLFSPKNLAAVKHTPERLAPGMKAKH